MVTVRTKSTTCVELSVGDHEKNHEIRFSAVRMESETKECVETGRGRHNKELAAEKHSTACRDHDALQLPAPTSTSDELDVDDVDNL